jgi:hypothetical protein
MRTPLSRRVRFRVLERDGFRCLYCGRKAPEVELHVDHFLPVSKGGTNDLSNLFAACVDCNVGKRDRVLPASTSFLTWLRKQIGRDDLVGDFARDEERSPLHEPCSFRFLSTQLRLRGACLEARCAAWHAWREHQRGGKPTRAIQKMHNESMLQSRRPVSP